jgi:hypothetical protein
MTAITPSTCCGWRRCLLRSVQVPYESLRRSVRERKYIVDGVKSVVTSLTTNANNSGLTNEERLQDLDKLVSKLTKMKRKVCVALTSRSLRTASQELSWCGTN